MFRLGIDVSRQIGEDTRSLLHRLSRQDNPQLTQEAGKYREQILQSCNHTIERYAQSHREKRNGYFVFAALTEVGGFVLGALAKEVEGVMTPATAMAAYLVIRGLQEQDSVMNAQQEIDEISRL